MKEYWVSFHCYYPNGNKTEHRQRLPLDQIGHWIECYQFTHPMCNAITAKVWTSDVEVLTNE